MQTHGHKVKIYRTSTLILCAVCFAAYLVSYLNAGAGSDYFHPDQALPKIAGALSVVSVLWFLSALVWIPKNTLPAEDFMRSKLCIAAVPPIIGTLGAGALGLTYFSLSDLAAVLTKQQPIGTNAICFTLVILGTLGSVIYYALRAINASGAAEVTVIFGLGPVALLTGLCGLTYFESDHHMNAPAKLALQLAFVATMLFLTAEMRYTLHRAQPRRYLASACLGLFSNTCALAGAFPVIISPAQAVHGTRILGFALLCLCNGVYIAYRLFAFTAYCNKPTTPDTPEISNHTDTPDTPEISNPTDTPDTPEQTQGKDDQEDGCEQQDPMAS